MPSHTRVDPLLCDQAPLCARSNTAPRRSQESHALTQAPEFLVEWATPSKCQVRRFAASAVFYAGFA